LQFVEPVEFGLQRGPLLLRRPRKRRLLQVCGDGQLADGSERRRSANEQPLIVGE
jgi:hypothetical protein